MVDKLNENPVLKEVIATATDAFVSHEQLGYLMADAQRDAAGADMAFINPGGVRIDNLPAGPVTVTNIYQLDPFGNELVLTKLTGNEVVSMIFSAYKMENNHPVIPSGVKLKIKTDENGTLKEVLILNNDGSPLDMIGFLGSTTANPDPRKIMKPSLLALLQCPVCKSDLVEQHDGSLQCSSCGSIIRVENGIPLFTGTPVSIEAWEKIDRGPDKGTAWREPIS